ncbi:fimbrial protein [Entomohabitans teleogrylli]|uniref:fimbrial protein n=1 Tax=Entomohabitans teleogrylli TaxID=1384589 RepID=UPI00073D6FB7|nr:fimbrial protein [Entomohabitans teleogrylli]
MKKSILAVLVAATAVLSGQAFALNTAQVVIHGKVTDANNSCDVTPGGAITGGTVVLDDITDATANQLANNTLSPAHAKDIVYKVENCMNAGVPATGLKVTVTGTNSTSNDILDNEAAAPAAGVGLGMTRNSARVKFDGSAASTMTEAYTVGTPTILTYKVSYVKLPGATVTKGDVKGVATFTITYP